MANQLGSNPWVIDTPGPALLFATNVKAAHFEFSQYAADTDNVIVVDRFGKEVWAANGNVDLSPVESFTVEWIHGISVPTLSSGKLRVYFK